MRAGRKPVGLSVLAAIAFGPLGAEGQEQPTVFKVIGHLMAPKVGFGPDGRCRAEKGPELAAWRLAEFPATIGSFESCFTLSSPDARGLVDFEVAVIDSGGRVLQQVDGAIDLGDQGSASQAVNWDHLEIPKPGRYHMRLSVDGRKLASFPMDFKLGKASSGGRPGPTRPRP